MAPKRTKQGKCKGTQQIAKHEESTKVFEFLKLPAELRNMIYWNVLAKRHLCYRFTQPSLTLVNKQIRSESLPVLYRNGLFFVKFEPNLPIHGHSVKLPAVPAIPILANITKLDIRIFFGRRRFSRKIGVAFSIYMRADKFECGSMGDDNLVDQSLLGRRDEAKIKYRYHSLLSELFARSPLRYIEAIISAEIGMGSVIRTLLSFAERCPAAAKWVWMKLEIRDHVA